MNPAVGAGIGTQGERLPGEGRGIFDKYFCSRKKVLAATVKCRGEGYGFGITGDIFGKGNKVRYHKFPPLS